MSNPDHRATDAATIFRSTVAWALSFLAMGLAVGCAEPETHTRAKSASDFEADTEYQEGLSKTLESAPTSYAADALTNFYDLGYTTGRLEGDGNEERERDENKNLGCEVVIPFLLAVHPETADQAPCASMLRPAFASAKFSGPRFYESRLLVVRKGAEAGDRDIARATLTAYENGYAMGFSHVHDAPGRLDRMRAAVKYGCNEHLLAEHRAAPLTNDQLTALATRCETIASDSVNTYVNELAKRRGQP